MPAFLGAGGGRVQNAVHVSVRWGRAEGSGELTLQIGGEPRSFQKIDGLTWFLFLANAQIQM